MYIPTHFAEPNTAKAAEIIKANPFAILMTASSTDVPPEITHLPLLIRETENGPCLIGHVARANPHWKMFDGKTSAVAIFSGPDAYVSPTWYDTSEMVPTWNYAAVHVHGCPMAMDDMTAARAALADLVTAFESPETGNWSMDRLTEERIQRQLKAIVAFEMPRRPEGPGQDEINQAIDSAREKFRAAIADDLNTSVAFAVLYEFMTTVNRLQPSQSDARLVLSFMTELDAVLGVLDAEVQADDATDLDTEIQGLIAERNTARSSKNFQRSDEIRDQLLERGIVLVDTPQGTDWRKSSD